MLRRLLGCVSVLAFVSAFWTQTACGGCYPVHAVDLRVTGSACLTAVPGAESGTCPSVATSPRVTVLADDQCGQDFVVAAVGDSGVAPAPVKAGESGHALDETLGTIEAGRVVVTGTIGTAAVTVSWTEDTYTK
jgi:hypothetical protein